jgi:hypothetical protein
MVYGMQYMAYASYAERAGLSSGTFAAPLAGGRLLPQFTRAASQPASQDFISDIASNDWYDSSS